MITDTITAQDDIRCLVNRRISIMRTEVGDIKRDLASPFRGDKRSKNHYAEGCQ